VEEGVESLAGVSLTKCGLYDVTVIMTAHNEARFIRDAVTSVQMQTHRPRELILVDDGCTDETVEIARSIAVDFPLRVLRNVQPTGASPARNWGLREARTEWVAILDADDVWMPEKLEEQFRFIEAWDGQWPIAVLGSMGRHINEAGRDIGVCEIGVTSAEAFWGNLQDGGLPCIVHSSALFRREDALAVDSYVDDGAEDLELWERMSDLTAGVVISLDKSLVLYRKKRGGKMHTNVWAQCLNLDRLSANRRRRQEGLPPLTREEYVAFLRSQRLRERVRRWLRWKAVKNYRFGATNYVNGRKFVGSGQLSIAMLLNPGRVRSGIRRFRR